MFELPWELDGRPFQPQFRLLLHLTRPTRPTNRKRSVSRARRPCPFLREEEIERLFAGITSIRDRAIFPLAYHAGLRASEIGMLELRDYDTNTDRILIHRLKGSNSREGSVIACSRVEIGR